MDAFIPLLPQNFLVSYSDVVPGLRRFDTAGQLSVTSKQVISTMANPMLCPTHRCDAGARDRCCFPAPSRSSSGCLCLSNT